MRSRPTSLLVLALALAVAGCISQSEWDKYNKKPGENCTSSDECGYCTEDSPKGCEGPSGDSGLCLVGVCRMTKGEIGLNCSAASTCDYGDCVYASSSQYGICSKVCDDSYCPGERSACVQTPRTGGGTMNWCAHKCATSAECDTNATCQSISAGYMVCFPS
jgi:hypothetical protein